NGDVRGPEPTDGSDHRPALAQSGWNAEVVCSMGDAKDFSLGRHAVAIAWVSQRRAMISQQGEQVCGFTEALAQARENAQRLNLETIYTFDDSTWGNA